MALDPKRTGSSLTPRILLLQQHRRGAAQAAVRPCFGDISIASLRSLSQWRCSFAGSRK